MTAPGLGACYTWKQECYPVPDPCGTIQHLQVPQACPETQVWFWGLALAIAVAGALVSSSRGGGA